MDHEMIERVAKAIFEKRYEAVGSYQNLKWKDYKGKDFYIEDAKQAIKAMSEPTEKMINSPRARCYNTGPYGDKEVRRIFTAMIDAVIND